VNMRIPQILHAIGVMVLLVAGSCIYGAESDYDLFGQAIWSEDIHAVDSLISTGADINARQDNSEATPLLLACYQGNRDVIRLLLENGAEINAANAQGQTPLIVAASGKNFSELVPLLVEEGAEVNAVTNDGLTALFEVIVKVNKYGTETILKTAELLVRHGARVDPKIGGGFTPLMYVTREGSAELVEFLITNGANVNAKTEDKRTPLSIAREAGDQEIIDLLQEHGAK